VVCIPAGLNLYSYSRYVPRWAAVCCVVIAFPDDLMLVMHLHEHTIFGDLINVMQLRARVNSNNTNMPLSNSRVACHLGKAVFTPYGVGVIVEQK